MINNKSKKFLVIKYNELSDVFHKKIKLRTLEEDEVFDFQKLFVFMMIDTDLTKANYKHLNLEANNITKRQESRDNKVQFKNLRFINLPEF